MNFHKILIFIFLLFLNNCATEKNIDKEKIIINKNIFSNKGFTLIYDSILHKNGKIPKKINDRSLIILQKNLKKNTKVKITNILNGKSIIATVGANSDYPSFYNSVITKRIANKLEVNFNEPYIEVSEIFTNSTFVAKKAKTFDEEKIVADSAPIDSISINDLNENKKESKKSIKKTFKYAIKIADFYFKDTAKSMIYRIKKETNIKKININKLSKTKYRVLLGPYNNLNSLQKAFNDINILEFENIEIIQND